MVDCETVGDEHIYEVGWESCVVCGPPRPSPAQTIIEGIYEGFSGRTPLDRSFDPPRSYPLRRWLLDHRLYPARAWDRWIQKQVDQRWTSAK